MSRKLITLTGPSGIGKGYVKKELKKLFSWVEPPFYTTRKRRPSDDGTRIHIPEEEFIEKVNKGEINLVNEIYGHKYGLDLNLLEEMFLLETPVIMELYIDNVALFRDKYPFAKMFAFIPSSPDILLKNMEKRGDNEEEIEKRLIAAECELEKIEQYVSLFDDVFLIEKENKNLVRVLYNHLKDYLR